MSLHNIYGKALKQRTSIALLGTGHFSTAALAQVWRNEHIDLVAVVDRSADALQRALREAEIPDGAVCFCQNRAQALAAVAQHKTAALADAAILPDLPQEIVVEATGNPEAGARHILAAIEAGQHIINVNKEVDSCVGPMLKRLAEEKGLIYTPIDGDQHGALMQLVDWARDIGAQVICAGKSRDAEFVFDREARTVTVYEDGVTIHKTVTVSLSEEEAAFMEGADQGQVAQVLQKRKELLQALDPRGGFDLCEMVIAANATGLIPDTPLLHDPILRTPELPMALCTAEDGGMLQHSGVIEVVTNLHEKREAGMGGGEFMVLKCPNPYSQRILATKGCLCNDRGSVSLVYQPYHLCGVEAVDTILCVGLAGVAIGAAQYEQRYDIVQQAVVDLKAGEVMGNDHDTRLLTRMAPMSPIAGGGPVPAHLLSGCRLRADVPKGTVITYGMVQRPEGSALWELRERQDALYGR